MARRERRLAGARDANERHEAEFGDVQFGHGVSVRVKIAAWVGVPSRGSASPTPRSSTLYPFSDAVRPARAERGAFHLKRWSGSPALAVGEVVVHVELGVPALSRARGRAGALPKTARSREGQPVEVDVLDHLRQHDGVEAEFGVELRRLPPQPEPGPHLIGKPFGPEAPLGAGQLAR